MRWTKLNVTFDAEPNGPEPRVSVEGDIATVRFFLNPYIWDDVEDGDEGELVFAGVVMYRLGATNDEGFYRGQCRFSKTGISWGDFYELFDSQWETNFPRDRVIVSTPKEPSQLHHYLYYFRDHTFECIAHSWQFWRVGRVT